MSFIRKIKRNGRVYLAEVENRWVNGKCVQKHIRYIGRAADGETILSSSISHVQVEEVKCYGPLLVLDHLARSIGLPDRLGRYGDEILSMVYAHCQNYKSINRMQHWFERTDLNHILQIEGVTEKRLLQALDSLEHMDWEQLQSTLFLAIKKLYRLKTSAVAYDVTNTYVYGKKCPTAKRGRGKHGDKTRPLIQIGLGVTQREGIPLMHKVFDGNVNDSRTLVDMLSHLERYKVKNGMMIYDRGVTSQRNIQAVKKLGWDVLCGMPFRGTIKNDLKSLITNQKIIQMSNRVRLQKVPFYVITTAYEYHGTPGTLAVCFNEQQRRDLRESRYDELLYAKELLHAGKTIKPGLSKFFDARGRIMEKHVQQAEVYDGYSCLFCTRPLPKEEMVRLYFDKDIVEKAFRSIKGITDLQPVRHWLYNRVRAHIAICYLSYLLLSMLKYRLRKLGLSAEKALETLDSMYKVYLKDPEKGFQLSRVVTLTSEQEHILKAISPDLVKS